MKAFYDEDYNPLYFDPGPNRVRIKHQNTPDRSIETLHLTVPACEVMAIRYAKRRIMEYEGLTEADWLRHNYQLGLLYHGDTSRGWTARNRELEKALAEVVDLAWSYLETSYRDHPIPPTDENAQLLERAQALLQKGSE